MRGGPSRRRLLAPRLALALLAIAALPPATAGASAGDALRPGFPAFESAQSEPTEREIGGRIEILQGGDGSGEGGCGYTVPVLRYADVPRAIGYRAVYHDTYYGRDQTIHAPPFQDDSQYGAAPAGTHQHELAGLFGSGTSAQCGENAAYYRSRFTVVSVVAILPDSCPVDLRKAAKDDCEEAKVSGRVATSFGKGVGNVEIEARPAKGKRRSVITDETGEFTFTFAKPANQGPVVLTPKPLADQKISPRSATRTLAPGATQHVKFEAEVGRVKGTVRELLCPAPVSRANCRKRIPREAAVVALDGSGVREAKFATTEGPDGSYSFEVPPGRYRVLVDRVDVDGSADVCQDDKALPVIVGDPAENQRPAKCAGALVRTGAPETNGRERVTVRVREKGTAKVNFLAVPHRALPVADVATFRGGKRKRTSVITAGIVRPAAKSLFGEVGSAGPEYRPAKRVIQCESGCATVNVLVTNLLGEALDGAEVQFEAEPVSPGASVVGLEDGAATNTTGQVCFVGKGPGADCGAPRGKTDKAGRALGLYAAPGVVPPQPPAMAITAGVGVSVPAQTVPRRGSYPAAGPATERLGLRPNRRVRARRKLPKEHLSFLNHVSHPEFIQNGINSTTDRDCFALLDFLRRTAGSVNGGEPEECGVDADPSTGRPLERRPLPPDAAARVDHLLKNGAIGLAVLDGLGLVASSFGRAFGHLPSGMVDFKVLPVNSALANLVTARRAAQGGRITTPSPWTVEMYEVSRLFNMSTQPAVYLDLRATAPDAHVTSVIGAGYEPRYWPVP